MIGRVTVAAAAVGGGGREVGRVGLRGTADCGEWLPG